MLLNPDKAEDHKLRLKKSREDARTDIKIIVTQNILANPPSICQLLVKTGICLFSRVPNYFYFFSTLSAERSIRLWIWRRATPLCLIYFGIHSCLALMSKMSHQKLKALVKSI